MIDREFEMIETNGVTLRAVVAGKGPLVILLHGWPQFWYLWRHQIEPIVAAGFKVVVPDQRGYCGSSKPPNVADYHIRELVADVDGIREALGYDECIVIGQDWGCVVAWFTALCCPKTCRAVMGLSVPFWRLSNDWLNPPGMDDRFWYMRYFQDEGPAEAELDADIERSLRTIYYALSADSPPKTWMNQREFPQSVGLLDALPEPGEFSGWLTSADLDYYVEQFRDGGFRGPVNWYRNIPRADDLMAELADARFKQPAAFAAGALDDVLYYDTEWRAHFLPDFDDMRFVEIVDGAGHWLQAEAPDAVNQLILRFLKEVG